MSRSPKPKAGTSIFLFTLGIALIIVAVIILLKGLGILPALPNYVLWALGLLAVGIGIIGGLRTLGD